jgi:uroporphyrinogen decarboxylase
MVISSLERVFTVLDRKEPDKVPFFLLVTMHGASDMGMSIPEYFSKAENVVEGQSRMLKRYGHDCLYTFLYAPIEIEAWGGEVIFYDDGPPNSGRPFLDPKEIGSMELPDVHSSAPLLKVLKVQRMLRERHGEETPIIGMAMSPFSLPVMQMGFDKYLDMLLNDTDSFWELMSINERFCIDWANAQMEAGAHAIIYFDPVSSVTIIPPDLYVSTGKIVAQRTLKRIKGPTATHFASGRCLKILDDVIDTGTSLAGVSGMEGLPDLLQKNGGRMTLFGGLNGLTMRRWTPEQTALEVKRTIQSAATKGRFILSDNHGEIPWQVPTDVLHSIAKAVNKYGHYPIAE